MIKQKRSFIPESKLEAASLDVDQNYSNPEACRTLDADAFGIRRW
jgi:transposase